METFYDAIYLSPHLDDVVLSCGGQIFQQTAVHKTILIVTIMAGDPPYAELSEFAQGQHQRWQLLTEATAQRRAEDVAACRLIGADHTHWQIPDCIYRHNPQTGKSFYNSDDEIFGAVQPIEGSLVVELAQKLAQLPPHQQLFVPLTLGNHVDHQLTRLAAERCFGDGLFYYEDYPYVQRLGGVDSVIRANINWQPQTIPLTPLAIQTKIEAIAAYASQIDNLFGDMRQMAHLVSRHSQQTGGERIWQLTIAN
jgi:LmbE family N-acetylglucosaminyl deacetylase